MLPNAINQCFETNFFGCGWKFELIGVVVDPLYNDAAVFYKKFGFILMPDSRKMFLPMADVALLGL